MECVCYFLSSFCYKNTEMGNHLNHLKKLCSDVDDWRKTIWNLYSEAHHEEKGLGLTLGAWGKNTCTLTFLGQNTMLEFCSIIII